MEQNTEQAVVKTAIRPNIANMVKTKGGSYHKDDFVGVTLAGLSVAQVLAIGSARGIDVTKYAHLNPGQQRMTVGNKLRAMTAIKEVPEIDGKPDQNICDANEKTAAVRDAIEDMAAEMKEANAAEAQAKADAKAKAAAEKAAAKAKVEAPKATESESESESEDVEAE